MSLSLKKKNKIVCELKDIIKISLSAVLVDFCGINGPQITKFRKLSRLSNVYIKIIRNNLIYRVIKHTLFESLKSFINGSVFIVFSINHPSSALRVIKSFIKDYNVLKIKAASFEGKLIIKNEEIDFLTNLPSHKESILKFILFIKEIFILKFIRLLYNISKL